MCAYYRPNTRQTQPPHSCQHTFTYSQTNADWAGKPSTPQTDIEPRPLTAQQLSNCSALAVWKIVNCWVCHADKMMNWPVCFVSATADAYCQQQLTYICMYTHTCMHTHTHTSFSYAAFACCGAFAGTSMRVWPADSCTNALALHPHISVYTLLLVFAVHHFVCHQSVLVHRKRFNTSNQSHAWRQWWNKPRIGYSACAHLHSYTYTRSHVHVCMRFSIYNT